MLVQLNEPESTVELLSWFMMFQVSIMVSFIMLQ